MTDFDEKLANSSPDADDPAQHWLAGLKAGDSTSASRLWDRYFSQLVLIAQARMRGTSAECSGEDVALSAMKSVMLGLQQDRFPDLNDPENLWPLLVTITARKAITQRRRDSREKRAAGRTFQFDELMDVVGNEPSPEFATDVTDTLDRLVEQFDDPALAIVAQRKLEGWNNAEIARELAVSVRTVIRKTNLIRQEWSAVAE